MIDLKDERILKPAGIYIAIIILFWAFIHRPAAEEMSRLKSDLELVKKEIAKVKSGHEGKAIKEISESFKEDLEGAMKKLRGQEKKVVSFLLTEANRLGIDVISMRPETKMPLFNTANNKIFLESGQGVKIPISISMRGHYKAAGEYLKVLREYDSALIKIEDIKMASDEAISPKLQVDLRLTLCLLSQR
ncbi:MAG: hypothetical protein HQ547_02800 [Candidatus Omnitrophica bacterium]|nr:hypothetical protein [Candidatus Omnitrophota bacterium]